MVSSGSQKTRNSLTHLLSKPVLTLRSQVLLHMTFFLSPQAASIVGSFSCVRNHSFVFLFSFKAFNKTHSLKKLVCSPVFFFPVSFLKTRHNFAVFHSLDTKPSSNDFFLKQCFKQSVKCFSTLRECIWRRFFRSF